MKFKKDNTPVIYKQEIMDENGKLNTFGALLVICACVSALNIVFNYLHDNIIDKKNIN